MSTDTKTKPVFAELSEDGKKIEIYFKPSPKLLDAMHRVHAKFMNAEHAETPHWRIDLDFETMRQVTVFCGGADKVELGAALEAWGQKERELEKAIDAIYKTRKPDLSNLKKKSPKLYEAIWLGPLGKDMTPAERKNGLAGDPSFQAIDTAIMSAIGLPLNSNHPGLGKTLEAIAAILQSGTEQGPNLVIAPVTSIDAVWFEELMAWQPHPIILGSGERMKKAERLRVMREVQLLIELGETFWLVLNPEMVRMRKRDTKGGVAEDNLYPEFETLFEIEWSNIIADEVHKKGIRNVQSVTAIGMQKLKLKDGGKRIALSGTPMGGKPINMFGILQWLQPEMFSSKWMWAQRWLQLDNVAHQVRGAKRGVTETSTVIGDVREDRLEEFDRHLKTRVVRRTKEEVLPWLPPKDRIPVWCDMTEAQAAQYMRFAKMAEIELGDQTLSATSVLAIYTRLKQFASATCMFDDNGKLIPTTDSGKIKQLEEKLEELGIISDDDNGKTSAQALVFTQFKEMADMVYHHLTSKGVRVSRITGSVKDRAEVRRSFQSGDAQVCVMTTTAGGVSITMDMADTVFILDETWNPDDQEQAEDRAHRASRIHQVTVYYLRSSGTIEQYIKAVTDEKGRLNKRILDERRIRLY